MRFWDRATRRVAREARAWSHTLEDRRLLAGAARLLEGRELRVVCERLRDGTAVAPEVARIQASRNHTIATGESDIRAAAELLGDEITLFRIRYPLRDPGGWHRDPLRSDPWPLRSHAHLRLDNPARPGDVRMQWEPARFHHALLLARLWAGTHDPAYPAAFLRQVDSFERGNPPFRGIHWSVGMEVALRASSWILTLSRMRDAPPIDAVWRERMVRALLLHGLFLESHLERHPRNFTTNHTLSDHAGLAVLGRCFAETSPGRRWTALAARGLAECLREQVLPGGAHAEASLPYERYVLEASLIAALSLPPGEAAALRPPIVALGRHLRSISLSGRLPFVGDGDDSFFPPFAADPDARRDPLDPGPVLRVLDHGFGIGRDAAGAIPPPGSGLFRFCAGPFEGVFIHRRKGEGWLPTHGHNDLLSIVLDAGGKEVLIDPGTGGYGWDRRLRHRLRTTAAHNTLQVDGLEQSPIRERATFEGPAEVPGGWKIVTGGSDPDRGSLRAWHDGFGGGLRHTRRLRWRPGRIWILDRLDRGAHEGEERAASTAAAGPKASGQDDHDTEEERATWIRFHLAPGLAPVLEEPSRTVCRVPLAGGTIRLRLLRPAGAVWQIEPGPVSRRYGSRQEAAVLVAAMRGRLPHQWATVLEFEEET